MTIYTGINVKDGFKFDNLTFGEPLTDRNDAWYALIVKAAILNICYNKNVRDFSVTL